MEYDVYPWNNTNENKYQYNGKELNDDFGLNLNHQDWRWLDVATGRWITIDPECENGGQESFSPYHFGFDNPIRYNDPDGRFPFPILYPIVVAGLEAIGAAIVDVFVGVAVVTTAANVSQNGVQPGTRVAHYPNDGLADTQSWQVQRTTTTRVEAVSQSKSVVKNDDNSKNTTSKEGEKKSNVSSGNKNSAHANQKAKESAQKKYEELRETYNRQKSQPNKTPEDKKNLEATRRQMEAAKKKADYTGENHSRNAKGN